jgi:hypothetical protein
LEELSPPLEGSGSSIPSEQERLQPSLV